MGRKIISFSVLAAMLAAGNALAGDAHVHGHATLEVAIDGGRVDVRLAGALDGFVGFEHAPRTTQERTRLEAARAALADGAGWLRPSKAAGCRTAAHSIETPHDEDDKGHDGEAHAGLEANWRLRCDRPAVLEAFQLRLFEAFPGLQRVDAVVVGPAGQRAARLNSRQPGLRLR